MLHQKDGMVNVNSKKCCEIGCTTRANFNIRGLTALYCFEHKKRNMINVNGKNAKLPSVGNFFKPV